MMKLVLGHGQLYIIIKVRTCSLFIMYAGGYRRKKKSKKIREQAILRRPTDDKKLLTREEVNGMVDACRAYGLFRDKGKWDCMLGSIQPLPPSTVWTVNAEWNVMNVVVWLVVDQETWLFCNGLYRWGSVMCIVLASRGVWNWYVGSSGSVVLASQFSSTNGIFEYGYYEGVGTMAILWIGNRGQ